MFAWTIPFCPFNSDNEGEFGFTGSVLSESRKSGLNDLLEVTQAVSDSARVRTLRHKVFS